MDMGLGKLLCVLSDAWLRTDTAYQAAARPFRNGRVNWQPIETAPRDGTEILGWRRDCGVLVVKYTSAAAFLPDNEIEQLTEEEADAMDWFCADFWQGERLEGIELPTHWMPLPDEPSA